MQQARLTDRIAARLEQLQQAIVDNIEQKGITASGRTQHSLTVEVYAGGVRLTAKAGARAPFNTLEIGRSAGNVPGGFRTTKKGVRDVSNTFKAILVQWARDKGIGDFGWAAATMLGRRIAAEGTLRNRQHENVYSDAVEKAAKDIQRIFLTTIQEQIKSNF